LEIHVVALAEVVQREPIATAVAAKIAIIVVDVHSDLTRLYDAAEMDALGA
jgi:hypothetical protein